MMSRGAPDAGDPHLHPRNEGDGRFSSEDLGHGFIPVSRCSHQRSALRAGRAQHAPPSSAPLPPSLGCRFASLPSSALCLPSSFDALDIAASVRYCADGGANRLYDRFVKGKGRAEQRDEDGGEDWTDDDAQEDTWLPHLVLGDLDSLRADVRAYYEGKGVAVEQDPDEFSTDLGKNVTRLSSYEAQLDPPQAQHQLVVVGGLSGRLDQTIHTLHALTLLAEKGGRERVWAIGKESAAASITSRSTSPLSARRAASSLSAPRKLS
ncbi:SPOSA6832_00214, partial [Sporobolomyces salmonicolor]